MSEPEINKNLMSINSIVSCVSFTSKNHDANVLDFLNNLVISDLNSLEPKQLHYSALCNPKGRIIATFWLWINSPYDVYLFCAQNSKDTLIQFFNARKFRLKINIAVAKNGLALIPQSNTLILIEEPDKLALTATLNDFYLLMLNKQLPWIDAFNTERFIPQHVNLDLQENVMSFTKGCYPGQEIVARIKYLGTIKKRMTTIQYQDKNRLIIESKDLEKVSPIIHNKTDKVYIIQVIKQTS